MEITEALQEMTGLKSVRLVSKLKEEICNALPRSCRNWIGLSSTQDMRNVQSFPEIRVSPVINEEDEGEDVDSILSLFFFFFFFVFFLSRACQ